MSGVKEPHSQAPVVFEMLGSHAYLTPKRSRNSHVQLAKLAHWQTLPLP